MHIFKKSLAAGQAGEKAILALWPELQPLDGREGDFVLPDGKKVELKTDSYSHDKTGNFFIEVYSDVDKGKVGGPAQADMHNCFYFAYFFPSHGICYVFETKKLLEQLKTVPLGRPVEIRNVRWTTVGHKVPRTLLTPVFVLGQK